MTMPDQDFSYSFDSYIESIFLKVYLMREKRGAPVERYRTIIMFL